MSRGFLKILEKKCEKSEFFWKICFFADKCAISCAAFLKSEQKSRSRFLNLARGFLFEIELQVKSAS